MVSAAWGKNRSVRLRSVCAMANVAGSVAAPASNVRRFMIRFLPNAVSLPQARRDCEFMER
jgi:hypothetical protein